MGPLFSYLLGEKYSSKEQGFLISRIQVDA